MSDLRPVIERELERIELRPFPIEGFHRRRNRRRRNQRIASVAVALVVTIAAVGLVVRAFGNAPRTVPASKVNVHSGSIAFVGRGWSWKDSGSLFVYDPATGRATKLVNIDCVVRAGIRSCPGVRINGVDWSPDGTRIAYSLQTSHGWEGREPRWTLTPSADGIYVLDLATGMTRQVTHCLKPSCNLQATLAWSPDGSTIAYSVQTFGSPGSSIWMMNADGSNPRQLNTGLLGAADPSWSPNGRQVAFTAGELFTVGLDRSAPRALDVYPGPGSGPHLSTGPSSGELFGPAWAPDGSRIAFIERTQGPLGRLWVTTLGKRGSRLISAFGPNTELSAPSWSLDGTRIAVIASGWLCVVRPDGTGLTKLTRAWSPVAPAWYPQ